MLGPNDTLQGPPYRVTNGHMWWHEVEKTGTQPLPLMGTLGPEYTQRPLRAYDANREDIDYRKGDDQEYETRCTTPDQRHRVSMHYYESVRLFSLEQLNVKLAEAHEAIKEQFPGLNLDYTYYSNSSGPQPNRLRLIADMNVLAANQAQELALDSTMIDTQNGFACAGYQLGDTAWWNFSYELHPEAAPEAHELLAKMPLKVPMAGWLMCDTDEDTEVGGEEEEGEEEGEEDTDA